MPNQRRCGQCGAVLPAESPQGLCPACLLRRGLSTGDSSKTEYIPPPPAELAQFFPELEILELIGRGGMGAVYKARQKRLDRLVAVKILPPNVSRDPAFAERFTREAKALARLTHPNIVTVHDFGQAGGTGVSPVPLYYFIMEFVDGLNLRQLLNAGQIAPKAALAIVPQICDALQYAHDKGIVHRDIKPENILLDKAGKVKIADFGLAKLVGVEAKDQTITGTRDVIGTPHYMAPEQIEHPQDVDHRADIYSLGVVFYQMLTGELPIGRFAPPSRKVRIDVRLDEVVLRALEKEPDRRYQQVSQFMTQVETIVTTPSVGVHRAPLQQTEDALRQVKWPAIGLIAAGILNWVFLSMKLIALQTHLSAWGLLLIAVIALLFTFLSGLMIYAGLKMMRLEQWRLAVTAGILAVIISPGNLVGFPIGIWALVVLWRREVRDAFGLRAGVLTSVGPEAKPSKAGTPTVPANQLRPSRCRWKRWSVRIAIGFVLAVILRTFFVQAFRAATDAAAPEIPRGSRFLVWKLGHEFQPGDLIAYRRDGYVSVGRVVRSAGDGCWVNRNRQADAPVSRGEILGKVISVYWRASNDSVPVAAPLRQSTTADQVAVEDLALRMLAAIRDKEDDALKSLAADRPEGWRDALPQFAFEMRERFRQMTGQPFDMRVAESLVEGNVAVVKCTGPAELHGTYLVLVFVKTADGWRNWSLRNSPPSLSLARHLQDFKTAVQKQGTQR